ncbi:hypothetical protein H0H92_005346 [Tricholoma furcatifolium]|nr:hypothetical protein H0H92_005346 [Tricholoma furcatifolium]
MFPPTPVDRSHASANNNVNINGQGHRRKVPITRPRPPPSPPARNPTPLSRKRGWEPTFTGASRSTTPLACSGYFDTPAKWKDMAEAERNAIADEFHEVEMFADTEMPPPAKRRRGLAGSIVSTALSAALIGTAVGLTVYRLWRDRGKSPTRLEESDPHQDQPPPPPYQQGTWTPESQPQLTDGDTDTNTRGPPAPPTTPKRKRERRFVNSANKRNGTYRRGRAHTVTSRTPASAPAQTTAFPNPQPEFDFTAASGHPEPTEVDDQMDWIGDKLSALIAEGKRALSREVVVMSDAQEDEVDDASGAWEDADVPPSASQHASPSRNSSIRRAGTSKRPRSLISPSAYNLHTQDTQYHHHHHSLSPSSSPTKSTFYEFAPSTSAPALGAPFQGGYDNMGMGDVTPRTSYADGWQEDERSWESPEVREAMERARARFRR